MYRRRQAALLFWAVLTVQFLWPAESVPAESAKTAPAIELLRYEQESSSVRIEAARMAGKYGLLVIFEGTDDLHYYAKQETAPAGYRLKVEAKAEGFDFGQPLFPMWETFYDSAQRKDVEVYVGHFAVFVPINAVEETAKGAKAVVDVEVTVSGIACTSSICLSPFEKPLSARIDYTQAERWKQFSFETPRDTSSTVSTVKGASFSIRFALGLAFLAGLSLNIMPCVWPVLPLIVMRIVEQAKQSRGKSMGMGLAFCFGILLFFASLAAANIVLQIFYGTVLQWGDQFRNPAFVAGMGLVLVVLALFMFGVFTVTVPAAISSKTGSGKGDAGSVGMGFLAAVLSTPCSFAILAAAFAWAQAQPLLPATLAIMVIGVGMAVPYAILTSMPALLKRIPKPGRWMELFKQAIGFVLLIIAVKLIAALPEARMAGVLYFAVLLAFCVWMWGGWVSYNSKPMRKCIVRVAAIILAVAAGRVFLAAPTSELINWQEYDTEVVGRALAEKKPVLVKFTADWCLSCQLVEKTVYSKRDIAELIEEKRVLAIKADTTTKDLPATHALKNTYNEPGVPVSMLFVPDEDEPVRWHGLTFADELKVQLQKLPSE